MNWQTVYVRKQIWKITPIIPRAADFSVFVFLLSLSPLFSFFIIHFRIHCRYVTDLFFVFFYRLHWLYNVINCLMFFHSFSSNFYDFFPKCLTQNIWKIFIIFCSRKGRIGKIWMCIIFVVHWTQTFGDVASERLHWNSKAQCHQKSSKNVR